MKHYKHPLKGVKCTSTIQRIYDALCDGRKLTNLDGLKSTQTMCLPKYISVLRAVHHIPIRDKWIVVGAKEKRVKLYWIDMVD